MMQKTILKGQLVQVSIAVTGTPQPLYDAQGKTWVEGLWGTPYAIVINNMTGGRLEILESVDGRNVLQDEPAHPVHNRGMVISAYSQWVNRGWRISDFQTNDFVFTDPGDAIAALATGSTKNVGVIGVAVYAERRSTPVFRGDTPVGRPESTTRGMPKDVMLGGRNESLRGDMGTGMGQSRIDQVGHTNFIRATPDAPAEMFEIQYRSRAWLQEKGIISAADDGLPSAWPGDTGYSKYRK